MGPNLYNCIVPKVSCLNYIIKFSQDGKVFVCDMVVPIKICKVDLFCMVCGSLMCVYHRGPFILSKNDFSSFKLATWHAHVG